MSEAVGGIVNAVTGGKGGGGGAGPAGGAMKLVSKLIGALTGQG